ncbi:MAG: hypothetical protein ACRCZO_02990, partial [Cetobacterium sp.]
MKQKFWPALASVGDFSVSGVVFSHGASSGLLTGFSHSLSVSVLETEQGTFHPPHFHQLMQMCSEETLRCRVISLNSYTCIEIHFIFFDVIIHGNCLHHFVVFRNIV